MVAGRRRALARRQVAGVVGDVTFFVVQFREGHVQGFRVPVVVHLPAPLRREALAEADVIRVAVLGLMVGRVGQVVADVGVDVFCGEHRCQVNVD